MSVQTSFITFNNGRKCPVLGLGTAKSGPGEVTQAVMDAIDAGYRHIDCAWAYKNEQEVGKGIRQKISQGVIKREDLFVTSKLWPTFLRPDLVPVGVEKSLKNLGLNYLDLYLIHWPAAFKESDEDILPVNEKNELIFSDVKSANYMDAWKEMEKLVEKGLVKSIGISNFNSKQVDDILSIAKIKPVTNQVECHPYLNQKKLKAYCESRGITITAHSPLGKPYRRDFSGEYPVLLEDSTILQLAKKYNKSPAQIVIKYQIQKGNIVVPKSVTKSRIIENANVFDFTMDDADFNSLDSLKTQFRFCGLDVSKGSKNYPFHIEF